MTADRSTSASGSSGRGERIASLLRLAAFALIVVGFVGWLEAGGVDLESPYTLAFLAGVACAIASIYLGIFLADADGR